MFRSEDFQELNRWVRENDPIRTGNKEVEAILRQAMFQQRKIANIAMQAAKRVRVMVEAKPAKFPEF